MTYFLPEGGRPGRRVADDVSIFCQHIFSSLPRSDQRRWAEVYIRGLLSVSGRKTVKRISDEVAGGDAEQCLQQFVNQSTWRSDLIRREVSRSLAEARDPEFWVLEDVVIPKNGRYSVAVDKQFAHSEGRILNCQLGMGLFLSGTDWSCPVNWRLPLPTSWESDAQRRAKTHIPPEERCKPRWSHLLNMIDETAIEWMMPPNPVVADLTLVPDSMPFLRGLEERELPYAFKVAANRLAPAGRGAVGTVTFGSLIADAARRNATVVNGWHMSGGRRILTRVIVTPLAPLPAGAARVRYLAAEWSAVRSAPRSVWVTTLGHAEVPRLLEAIGHASRVRAGMNALYEELGLRHFEGRSFPGWHHYTTLVTAAAACRLLSCWRAADELDMAVPDCLPADEYQFA
jgi:SRSO17 transposase